MIFPHSVFGLLVRSSFLIGLSVSGLEGYVLANPSPSSQSIHALDLITKKKVDIRLDQVKQFSVFIFLSMKCPCSNSYVEVIEELKKRYSKKGEIQFFGVHSNADEFEDASRDYFKMKNLSFPVLQDFDSVIADRYGALKTPHAFVINPKGEILYHGGIGNSSLYDKKHTRLYLEEVLASLVERKPVEEAERRTVGCVIKRPEKR